jgi:CRP-like cAMP-binding protein
VAKKAALAFDPKVFLAVVGSGKTISHYRKGEAIFAQGDPGDAVFFIRVEDDLIDQLFNSSEKRLARTLLLMAHYGEKDTPDLLVPKVSQATLAEIIGTTRSRVTQFMNKFRKLGLIDYNGVLKVQPSLLDVVLHEQPQIENLNLKSEQY